MAFLFLFVFALIVFAPAIGAFTYMKVNHIPFFVTEESE